MVKKCNLEITSFIGMSPGAVHCYGELQCNCKYIKLKYKLDTITAKLLSTKDYQYRAGMTSERFFSGNAIRIVALKVWKRHFPDATILLEGSSAVADPQHCLDGPDELQKEINRLWRRAEKIGGYEGDDEQMTRISDEYMELLKNFKPKEEGKNGKKGKEKTPTQSK